MRFLGFPFLQREIKPFPFGADFDLFYCLFGLLPNMEKKEAVQVVLFLFFEFNYIEIIKTWNCNYIWIVFGVILISLVPLQFFPNPPNEIILLHLIHVFIFSILCVIVTSS